MSSTYSSRSGSGRSRLLQTSSRATQPPRQTLTKSPRATARRNELGSASAVTPSMAHSRALDAKHLPSPRRRSRTSPGRILDGLDMLRAYLIALTGAR